MSINRKSIRPRAKFWLYLKCHMAGIPFSPHRSHRQLKKLMPRPAQPYPHIWIDEAAQFSTEAWQFAQRAMPARNDAVDAFRYSLHAGAWNVNHWSKRHA